MPSLSIWDLIMQASFIVKLVMLLLFSASVISWVMIIQRASLYKQWRAAMSEFENQFWSGMSLNDLYQRLTKNKEQCTGMAAIFHAGFKEFLRQQQHDSNSTLTIEACQRAMRVSNAYASEQLEKHLSFLATVGSTSPYVGLFGTVWGIMSSFQSLGMVQQATIAMVAPGISEALIATAMGLFAAIPAVIAYNKLSNELDRLINKMDTFQEEFISILQRRVMHTHLANKDESKIEA